MLFRSISSLQTIGSKIISLTKFWCSSLNSDMLPYLHLILYFDTTSLPCQALIIQRTNMDPPLAEEEDGEEAGGNTSYSGTRRWNPYAWCLAYSSSGMN